MATLDLTVEQSRMLEQIAYALMPKKTEYITLDTARGRGKLSVPVNACYFEDCGDESIIRAYNKYTDTLLGTMTRKEYFTRS